MFKLIAILLFISSPIIVLLISYLVYKIVPNKRIQYISYICFIIIFVIFNSLQISFFNDVIDLILTYILLTIISVFCWNLLKIKNKGVKISLVSIFILFYVLISLSLFFAGLAGTPDYISYNIVFEKSRGSKLFYIKENDPSGATYHSKIYTFYKKLSFLPFEKEIDRWATGESIFYTENPEFKFEDEEDSIKIYHKYSIEINSVLVKNDTVHVYKDNW